MNNEIFEKAAKLYFPQNVVKDADKSTEKALLLQPHIDKILEHIYSTKNRDHEIILFCVCLDSLFKHYPTTAKKQLLNYYIDNLEDKDKMFNEFMALAGRLEEEKHEN